MAITQFGGPVGSASNQFIQAGTGTLPVVFPVAFLTVPSVIVTGLGNAGGSTSVLFDYQGVGPTKTGFTGIAWSVASTGDISNPGGQTIYWIAVGTL